MKRIRIFVVASVMSLALTCLAQAQSYPPAWSSAATYAVGDQVQLNGNVLRAVRAVSPGSFKYSYWELWDVRANTTIIVGGGGQFPTLAAAWNYALNCRIARGAYLHLYIAGTHSEIFDAPFSLDHASGAQISVIGQNEADEVFSFNGVDGFTLDNGHDLGGLSNLTVQGSNSVGTPTLTSGTHGILVSTNATLATSGVAVSYFDTSLIASKGGTLICGIADNAGAADTVTFFGSSGVSASDHSLIDIESPITLDGRNSSTYGFVCASNSELIANGCTSANLVQWSYYAVNGGLLIAENSAANGGSSGRISYLAQFEGRIDAAGSKAANVATGYDAEFRGIIDASNTTVTSATVDYQALHGGYIKAEGDDLAAVYYVDGGNAVNVLGTQGSYIRNSAGD